jgi:hypothetical protein
MKKVICSKRLLCGRTEDSCGHLQPHDKNIIDMGCEYSFCGVIMKNVSCKEVKEGIKEEVKK